MKMSLEKPIFIINFKNYLEASGDGASNLSKVAEKVAKELNVQITLCPPIPDISNIAKIVSIPVFAQHVDLANAGSTTGSIVPEVIKTCGATGSLLNHSERRIPLKTIKELTLKLKKLNLRTVICAGTSKESRLMAKLSPDFVAVEPPELIGSGRAVSKVKPEVIVEAVRAVKKVNTSVKLICGAGITSREDVAEALKLGAQGILVASAVIKADSWESKIRELAEPFFIL